MFFPTIVYFYEIKLRFYYIFISFCSCLSILFFYLETVLLFHVFPLLNIIHKRFISINITELFIAILFLLLSLTFLIIFNLIKNQFLLFFLSSWSFWQTKFFSIFQYWNWLNFIISYVAIHFIFLPQMLMFFLFWEIKDKYSLLQIETESRIKNYIFWILSINLSISSLFLSISFLLTMFFLFLGPFYMIKIINMYKCQIIFILYIIYTFFLSLDIISQILLYIFLLLFLEFFLFVLNFLLSYLII